MIYRLRNFWIFAVNEFIQKIISSQNKILKYLLENENKLFSLGVDSWLK
jgi:hypothetical protein